MKKTIVVWVIALIALAFINMWTGTIDPLVGSKLATQTVNGGDAAYVAQKTYENGKHLGGLLQMVLSLLVIATAVVITFGKKRPQVGKFTPIVILPAALLFMGGCKPYNKPVFVEVKPSQTVYVIPLVGENQDSQVKFDSKKYESFKKVGIRRIQIPMQWIQTGKYGSDGNYVPQDRVVLVDRSSLTRHWTKSSQSGSTNVDQAVHVESKDSVNFSMGFKVTAYIAEEDTSTFLYYNASRIADTSQGTYQVVGLDDIMDNEVLTRIQKVCAVQFGAYDLDEARAKKSEVYEKIDTEVIPFFKTRGITILSIAQVGGMDYENREIQTSIDKTVMDQQLKVSAEARRAAQEIDNQTINLKAEAESKATVTKANGEAEGKLKVQMAVAEGMTKVAEASKAAGSSEAFIKLQQLEVLKIFAQQYKGGVPAVLNMGDCKGGSSNMILPLTEELMRSANPPASVQPSPSTK